MTGSTNKKAMQDNVRIYKYQILYLDRITIVAWRQGQT